MSRRARLVLTVALVTLCAAWTGAISTPATAQTSTAVVVIDTGQGVRSATVNVGGGVSGMQALAAVAAVVQGFDGAAVCKVDGVGNDPGSCLVGPHGEYWSYWRATEDSPSWSYSSLGAAATTVHGGDVEGWRYGFGQAPRAAVCNYVDCGPPPTDPPPPPPTTAAPALAPAPAAAPPTPSGGSSGDSGPAAMTTAPATGKGKASDSVSGGDGGDSATGDGTKGDGKADGPTPSDAKTPGDSTSARTTQHREDREDREAALGVTGGGDDGGNGSPAGVLVVVAILLAVAAAVVVQQRRRRRAAGS